MEVKTLALGQMGTNCYLAWCGETREAIIIDPGSNAQEISNVVRDLNLKPKYIVNTHGHLDHIGANGELHQEFNCPIAIGTQDGPMLTDPTLNLSSQFGRPIISPAAEKLLEDGDTVKFGNCALKVLATPGHTPGGVCLYGHSTLFSGDTLFERSVGRTDFPGGSQRQLLEAIETKLLNLPDTVRVLPGHGPETNIGQERVNNPWLQG